MPHVPESLVYGPVSSRRFGRSLGVSCSWPGRRACGWRCAYCQLGHLPDDVGAVAPADAVVAAVATALRTDTGRLDAITIAGGGEPLDHPEFPVIVDAVSALAAAVHAPLVVLTNGDRLGDAEVRRALGRADRVWVKYDPGPRGGSWGPPAQRAGRLSRLAEARPLRIQAMLYGAADGPGCDTDALRRSWLDDLRALPVVEVHLTTVEREPGDRRMRPLRAERLAVWRDAAADALRIPVTAFPARSGASE